MGSALHFILLSSGLWTLALCASRQFYVVEQKLNWSKAQNHCRTIYTDLATIENDEEMQMVKNLVKNSSARNDNMWIGLKQNKTHYDTFNNKAWSWSDGALFNYTNWGDPEPDNKDGNNCVELYHTYSYKWNDAKCHHPHSFICYKRQIPLFVIPQNKTWREALKYCRQNYMDLVSVSTQKIQNWVSDVVSNNPHNATDVWIGLRHTSALDIWYWVNGVMICYHNWAPGNGTGVEECCDCERTGAMLSGSKQWVSLPETHKIPFICTNE